MEKNKGKAIDGEEGPLQDGESTRFCTGSSSSGDLSGVNTDINTDIRDDSNWNERDSRRFCTGSSSSGDLSRVNTDISIDIRDDSNWNAGDSRRFCTVSSSSGDLSGVNTDIRDDSNWNDPLGGDLLDVDAVVRALSQRYDEETSVDSKVRLLVVANRLPVTATRKGDGSWSLHVSVGGLVSALLGVKTFEVTWIGWAGINVSDEIGQRELTKALAEKNSIPVFLDEDLVHQYYNGYCNNILWPLFHYLGLPQDDQPTATHCFQSQFDAYKKANQLFADVVNEHYQEGDIIWCHDYHLMYLPKFLKEYNPNMKVGWFLHTPFPSAEIHRMLPSRAELLKSVLAADLVGFHTYDYSRHFVSACTRILGLEGTPQGIKDQGKLTRVAAFPIGIDSARFIRALEGPDAKQHLKDLQEMFAGRKVIVGVDRLDMIKGIPQKILAFEKFLMENPSWHDKVVLVQIAVPTRIDVPEYKKLTSQVHEIVGRINGRFGTLTGVPIHHLDRSLDFHALCALYATTDVALVTSLRDGMNLVSYEFVACQAAKKGVLILSEFAGAAQSLGAGAILVNPWSISEVASAITYALNMTMEERVKRHHHNFLHVTTYTAQVWAANFLSELHDITVDAQLKRLQVPRSLPLEGVVEKYHRSNHRLLILGFNATLTETIEYPGRRGGDQHRNLDLKLHPDLKEPLRNLCNDPRTTVVVVSGSDRNVLDHNFGDYNIWLAAENGMFLRPTNGEWTRTMPEHVNMDWVNSVKHVFEYFTERTPRSHYELRETSLVWNYKYSDAEFGRLQAKHLLQHLWTGPISNAAVEVLQGSRSVEVRSVGITKGAAIERIILSILSMLTLDGAGMMGEILHAERTISPIDFLLCAGHFLGKDEDIFTFLEPDRRAESSQAPRSNTYTPQVRKWSSEDLAQSKIQRTLSRTHSVPGSLDWRSSNITGGLGSSCWRAQQEQDNLLWNNFSSVLNIRSDNYFSIAVGREHSNARYLLQSSEEVVSFLKALAAVSRSSET